MPNLKRSPPLLRSGSTSSPKMDNISIELILKKLADIKNLCETSNQSINILIKENSELRDIIKDLKSEIETIKNDKSNKPTEETQTSYANMLRNNGPVVLITPKDSNQKSDYTKQAFKEQINPIGTNITSIRKAAKGAVVVQCDNLKTREKLLNQVKNKLGDKYEYNLPKSRKPKLQICGMSEKLSDEELLNYLIKQNEFITEESEIKVIKTVEVKNSSNNKLFSSIIETSPKTYKNMMAREKVYVKWDRCNVYENKYVSRCYKCLGFKHMEKVCTNKLACKLCAGEHESTKCSAVQRKCINCDWHVQNLNLQLNVNHDALSKECPV